MKFTNHTYTIYLLRCPYGFPYVGSTIHSMPQRLKTHKWFDDGWQYEIIETTDDPDREEYWITHYDSYHNGYNQFKDGGTDPKVMQERLLKYWQTEKGKNKAKQHSEYVKNWYQTEEGIQCRERLSKRRKENPWSLEWYQTEAGKKARQEQSERQAQLWILTDPNGNEFEVRNLTKFCKENGLHQGNMSSVASGRQKTCKGWKVRPK